MIKIIVISTTFSYAVSEATTLWCDKNVSIVMLIIVIIIIELTEERLLCRHHCLVVSDINKFLWMVRIGGSTERGRHIKEADYYTPQGEFRIDKDGSPVLLNCLMYKMCYYRFGSVYTEQGLCLFLPSLLYWFLQRVRIAHNAERCTS